MHLSRELPLRRGESAFLIIDVQNYCAHPDGAEVRSIPEAQRAERDFFFAALKPAVKNIARLQHCCRAAGIEVMFCVIENLTQDGRDRGLDYKITGFNVPKGSWDAQVLDDIAPVGDEIVISKTASSVFNATNIDYVLRSLGVKQLVITGIATDQCVESAIRDACDLGYLVTLVTDACATYSTARQQASENAIKGYCRQVVTADLIAEIEHRSQGRDD